MKKREKLQDIRIVRMGKMSLQGCEKSAGSALQIYCSKNSMLR
jgi:hypothetical protein